LVEWLEAADDGLRERYDRLFVPKQDVRYLRRNALVALGNTAGPEHRSTVEPFLEHDDPLLREHAEWALARIADRAEP
jgi:epoxyqueuosine reductase